MKNIMFFAAAALLLLGSSGAAHAQAAGSIVPTAQTSYDAARATGGRSSQASFQRENPTGLPVYEMRPDGLMINGLLPATGWQG
jgi:hypothetical protein